MKKMLLVSLLLIAIVTAIAQTMVGLSQFVVVNPSTTVPIALTNSGPWSRAMQISLIGKKDNRTANTSTVYIGGLSGNDSQPIEVPAGQAVGLVLPPNTMIDLSTLYLDVGTAGDGVMVLYISK